MTRRSQIFATAVLAFAMALPAAAEAGGKFKAFGPSLATCSQSVSMDGDIAAFFDEQSGNLVWYDFAAKEVHDTGVAGSMRAMPSLRGTKLAYLARNDGSSGYSVRVYDLESGTVADTAITSAGRLRGGTRHSRRWFDGEYVAYTNASDGFLHLHHLPTGITIDMGMPGDEPSIDGDYLVFGSYGTIMAYQISLDILTPVDEGYQPSFAGKTIVYEDATGELVTYNVKSGKRIATGKTVEWSWSSYDTDGERIAFTGNDEPIQIYDLSTETWTDTGLYGCSDGWSCWIVMSGDRIAYERWEDSTGIWVDSKWVEIYPSEDLDGNGVIDLCVPGWAKV